MSVGGNLLKALFVRSAMVAVLGISSVASAADREEVSELKQTLEQLRQEYEMRIRSLEERIDAAEQKAVAAQVSAETAPARGTRSTSGPSSADRSFNPAISLVLQGRAARYSEDPEEWSLPGFQLGGESGPGDEGLSISETELIASANVDDWFFAQATLGLHEEDGSTEVDLEEAFLDTLRLPGGLGLRIGRFFTETGYINTKHAHAWDFVDAPLTSEAFLGGHYFDDGLRLSWLAPTDMFVELGVEALRGQRFPGGGDGSRFRGDAQNYFARLGNDVGTSNSFRVGLSHLRAEPTEREGGHGHGHDDHEDETFSFGGDSQLSALDFIWKWAPDGDARKRNLVFQAEYFQRSEDGNVEFSDDMGDALIDYDGTQRGYYAQGVFQFMPRWRAGIRYDKLWADNDLRVTGNTSGETDDELLDESGLLGGHDPRRLTFMADYSHSEFSRLRLQYARDRSRPGDTDQQFLLQYVVTLGAHGAHKY